MSTMYDSDNPDSIPSGVHAAGYISGYAAAAWLARGFARFPNARRINVTPLIDGGDTFDVENFDLLPWEAPDAVQKARARGVVDPWVYLSYDLWGPTKTEFHLRGIPEPLWWIALYDGIAVLLPGAIAKQYADPARIPGHPHYDLSIVADAAFGGGGDAHFGPTHLHNAEDSNMAILFHPTQVDRMDVLSIGSDGAVYHFWGTTDALTKGAAGSEGWGGKFLPGTLSAAWYNDPTNVRLVAQAVDSAGIAHIREVDTSGKVVREWAPLMANPTEQLVVGLSATSTPAPPDNDSTYALKTHVHTNPATQTGPAQ